MIKLKYIGYDYSPVSETSLFVDDESDIKEKILERKVIILEDFLKSISGPDGVLKSDSYIIGFNENYEDSYSRQNKRRLFTYLNAEMRFLGIVGVIYVDSYDWIQDNGDIVSLSITLQIESRLDKLENDETNNKQVPPYFLATMLMRDNIKLDNNSVPESMDSLFDYLLLYVFKEQLQNALLKGYYKTYRRFEKNDDRIKGSIDIARHIKLNLGLKNNHIAYSYRENTVNNFLNIMIIKAYEHLQRKYPDLIADNFDSTPDLRSAINYLREETCYSNINTSVLLGRNIRPISHPYFTEYEDLRLTCMRILRNEGLSVFDGDSDNKIKSILFYLPDLWEVFLEDSLFRKVKEKTKLYIKAQAQVMNFGWRSNSTTTKYMQKTYPDFIVKSNKDAKSAIMILDAKFRPGWDDVIIKECSVPYLDDYDKCIRDMVSSNATASGVIFPTDKSIPESNPERIVIHPVSEYNDKIIFYTFPVTIPKVIGRSYNEWKCELYRNIDIIVDIMVNQVTNFAGVVID